MCFMTAEVQKKSVGHVQMETEPRILSKHKLTEPGTVRSNAIQCLVNIAMQCLDSSIADCRMHIKCLDYQSGVQCIILSSQADGFIDNELW